MSLFNVERPLECWMIRSVMLAVATAAVLSANALAGTPGMEASGSGTLTFTLTPMQAGVPMYLTPNSGGVPTNSTTNVLKNVEISTQVATPISLDDNDKKSADLAGAPLALSSFSAFKNAQSTASTKVGTTGSELAKLKGAVSFYFDPTSDRAWAPQSNAGYARSFVLSPMTRVTFTFDTQVSTSGYRFSQTMGDPQWTRYWEGAATAMLAVAERNSSGYYQQTTQAT
jgi:hypothetical protein